MRNNKKEKNTKKMIKTDSKLERLNKKSQKVNSDLDMKNNDWAKNFLALMLSLIENLECPDNDNR